MSRCRPIPSHSSRASLWLSSTILLVLSVPFAAYAQQTASTNRAAAAEEESPEQVVVTAQRREQRLQDVGISVTALGTESLADLNVNTATDLVRAVPSLKMNAYSSAQVVFNIRGVSQNDYGDQQEPPVAVYQDDSYSSSINSASFPVFDLARIETLRGPQGTLFGRNATGGANPVHLTQADQGVRRLRDRHLWPVQPGHIGRRALRSARRHAAGALRIHPQQGRRLHPIRGAG